MSFFKKLLNFVSSKKIITVIIKPYNHINISGFTEKNNESLTYTFNSGITIKQVMENINKYRSPARQVKTCYLNGLIVSDNLSIRDDRTLYVSF